MSVHSTEKNEVEKISDKSGSQIDLLSFHEQHAGRLVIEPECAHDRTAPGVL
jgi:hypothetical protein